MTIPVVYFRSSSFNGFRRCEQSAFISYILGIPEKSGKAADMGTIVHKALEICALAKKASQDGIKVIQDDILGEVETNNYNPEYLNELLKRSYDYYSINTPHHNLKPHAKWKPKDLVECTRLMWEALQYQGGIFDPMNRNVVDAEPAFDFEIDEDWASYEYNYRGEALKGKLALKGTIDLITDVTPKGSDQITYEIIDWKGLPVDTPLPTPTGWTTMGEVKVGDLVFDQDGKQTRVLGKSNLTNKDCYKITFDDKSEVICDCDHLWSLIDGSVVNIKDLKIKDEIKVASPIKTSTAALPIDPYVLGIWLGDGKYSSGEITINESFILEEIVSRGYSVGNDISSQNRTSAYTVYNLISQIKKLGLFKNKHIPEIYLRANYEQRLSLLRGLMDSDGNVNTVRKQAVFTSCNKKLSDDVKELLLTLGQRPNQANIVRDTTFKDNVKVYPISFRPIDLNPFLLPRKHNQITWTGKGNSYRRKVININKVKAKDTQCIMVDSCTNTYLCTKNMIPTHNTGKTRKDWATGETKDYNKLYMDPQLRIYHLAAKHLYPHVHNFIITIYYVQAGGPYTMHFDDRNIPTTLKMLQKKFEHLKTVDTPKLLPEINAKERWQCKSFCDYYKTTFEDHDSILPIIKRNGECMNKCEQIRHEIRQNGLDQVIEDYTADGYELQKYKDPGVIEE